MSDSSMREKITKTHKIVRRPMPYGRVLVVDDVETNIHVARGLMAPYGISVDSAESGLDALAKIDSGKKYDVVFIDHLMPEMDGIETTQKIRSSGYKAPVIAVTANDAAGGADIFISNGFDDFISKPIDVYRLDEILNKWVRDKHPEQAQKAEENAESKEGEKRAQQAGDSGIAEIFVRDAGKSLPILDELISYKDELRQEDLRKFVIRVHGLKSALANIGQAELSAAALKLETAGREGREDIIRAQTPEFLLKLRTYLDEISSNKQVRETEISAAEADTLCKELSAVKTACDIFDEKAADDALSKLRQISWPQTTNKVLSDIGQLLLHSDFDEAGKLAQTHAELIKKNKTAHISDFDIPGLDIQSGLNKFDNNDEMYLKVLRSFTESGRRILREISSPPKNCLDAYKILIHSAKGICFDIFAEESGRAAEKLEAAANKKDTKYIEKNNPDFLKGLEKLIVSVEDALQITDGDDKKPVKDTPDTDILKDLLYACRNFSMDKADEAINKIDAYEYTNDNGLVGWLHEKIATCDFTEITKRLESVL